MISEISIQVGLKPALVAIVQPVSYVGVDKVLPHIGIAFEGVWTLWTREGLLLRVSKTVSFQGICLFCPVTALVTGEILLQVDERVSEIDTIAVIN